MYQGTRNNFKGVETPSKDRNLAQRKAELSQLPGFRMFFNIVVFSDSMYKYMYNETQNCVVLIPYYFNV